MRVPLPITPGTIERGPRFVLAPMRHSNSEFAVGTVSGPTGGHRPSRRPRRSLQRVGRRSRHGLHPPEDIDYLITGRGTEGPENPGADHHAIIPAAPAAVHRKTDATRPSASNATKRKQAKRSASELAHLQMRQGVLLFVGLVLLLLGVTYCMAPDKVNTMRQPGSVSKGVG